MTENEKKWVRRWYWSGAVLVALILLVGGITRLTDSGLSMVDWKPLMGIVPPLSESEWQNSFEQYKQFPEYLHRGSMMSLDEYKFIYFWEYLHRILGRSIGLVFIIPFGYFVMFNKIDKRNMKRAVILLVLGAFQGFMGWYMVKSGLVDTPYVSPYRLAAHLSLAFMIFGFCTWFALDLYDKDKIRESLAGELKIWLQIFSVILVIQIVWGAFVAGLHAGHVYNTFPKMFDEWIPDAAWALKPFVVNLTENPAAVQLIHRIAATILLILGVGIWIRSVTKAARWSTKKWAFALFTVILMQYALGVFTLLYHVPVSLGVLHQMVALLLFAITIIFYHEVNHRVEVLNSLK